MGSTVCSTAVITDSLLIVIRFTAALLYYIYIFFTLAGFWAFEFLTVSK